MLELAPETIVDQRYRIISRVGSGGMADVYCAEDTQLGRRVALKLLNHRFAEDQEFVERFRREASSAAGLSHQNVVSVFDRGEWDGTYYIAMEFLEGRSLKALVQQEAPLDPVRAIDIAVQILRAARFAHQRGIVHRDLKPANVIVDEDDRVKVTDFGIARAGASDITQTGSIMGTAQYLSPEQAQGHSVSAQSDIYSIGILLYELLTGRIPFDGESAVTIAVKQVSELPVPPSALNPAVTPTLEWAVLHALEKDPANRFADAGEFIAVLEQARAELVATGVGSTAEFAAAGLGGAAAGYAAGAAGDPAYAAGAYAPAEDGAEYAHPSMAYPPPEDEGGLPPSWRKLWPLAALAAVVAIGFGVYALVHKSHVGVPNVVGQSETAAISTLQSDGFNVVPVTVICSPPTCNAPAGSVISMTPAAGASATKGSTIRIIVSSGPGTATVPDVAGIPRRAATRQLIRAGFKVQVQLTPSTTVPKGNVVSTSPPASALAQAGSRVTVSVSSGSQLVAVPNVVGQPKDNATTVLQANGFKVVTTSQQSAQAPGTVVAQNPPGGANAVQGSFVTLTIAKAAPTVAVPDVRGSTKASAQSTLSGAGFKPAVATKEVTDPAQNGLVQSQSPASGTKLQKGAKVTITVGHFTTPTPTPPTTQTTPTTPTTLPTTPTTRTH